MRRPRFGQALILTAALGCSTSNVPMGAPDTAGSQHDAGAQPAADAASPDLDASQARDADSATDAADGYVPNPAAPERLSETGLYIPGSTTQLAPDVNSFEPRYLLWADGADKKRFLYLPPGSQIDTSNMDAWSFPVGTKVWKEFSIAGKKLETRLFWKTTDGWFRVAFGWDEAQKTAVAMPRGAQNVLGTEHDVPPRNDCTECHRGSPDMLLGVSAIQLSHDKPGVTLLQLARAGKLSRPPPLFDFRLGEAPDPSAPAWAALGYLHANCGGCHNPTGMAWDKVHVDLWLRTAELGAPDKTQSYKTAIMTPLGNTPGLTYNVVRRDPAHSGIILRMMTRGSEAAMPPIASEIVDADGVALVTKWINGL